MEGIDRDPFSTESSKVSYSIFTLCPVVAVSICSYLLQKETSLMLVDKTLFYEYSRMSLGVIILLCSFSRTVVFGFTLGSWPI